VEVGGEGLEEVCQLLKVCVELVLYFVGEVQLFCVNLLRSLKISILVRLMKFLITVKCLISRSEIVFLFNELIHESL
jgi:hypothetical protein